MALNYIWIGLFVIGFVVGIIRLSFFGDADALPAMMDSTFEMSRMGFEMTLGLTEYIFRQRGYQEVPVCCHLRTAG